jgi:hypothetical protein
MLATALILTTLLAQVTPAPPTSSASPLPTASPASKGFNLSLKLPPGWHQTESGRYNAWRGPNGPSQFRLTFGPVVPDMKGPNAVAAITAMVAPIAARTNPNTQVSVRQIMVCSGTQPAYRVDGTAGPHSPAFMVIIPGTASYGLINYEILGNDTPEPILMADIDAICWP